MQCLYNDFDAKTDNPSKYLNKNPDEAIYLNRGFITLSCDYKLKPTFEPLIQPNQLPVDCNPTRCHTKP